MEPIVIELQHDALKNDIPVATLLRKAYVVAKKLKLTEFENWINYELNGYTDEAELPKYREVLGVLQSYNRYHGWQPVIFEDHKMSEIFSTSANGQTIAEIESLLEQDSEKNGMFQDQFSPEQKSIIQKTFKTDQEIARMIPSTALIKIVDSVRNIILNWALKLEEDGVLGEGMTFSKDEKNKAEYHSYNINNFYEQVNGSQIQQSSPNAKQKQSTVTYSDENINNFLSSLKSKINDLELNEEYLNELQAEIATVEIQTKSPKPKENIIKESLGSIRTILEGASGSAVGQLLLELGKFF